MNSHRLEREFGRVVGCVFLAVGVWTTWRGRWPPAVTVTLAALGLSLVILSLLYPAALMRPRRWWMALAEALSFVSTRVILAVVFFLGVWPLGFVMRRLGWDPLATRRPQDASHWRKYSARQRNPKHFEQMF